MQFKIKNICKVFGKNSGMSTHREEQSEKNPGNRENETGL